MEGQWLVKRGTPAVVYMEIGIPSLHLCIYMVYGGGSDMMCCIYEK